MIITVKNLQQQTFTIEFDPEKTVLELKKHIFKERGAEYIVEKQKLIYAGVILTDEQTISSYKVDEKKFIVVMLTRDVSGSASGASTTKTNTAATSVQKQQKKSIKQTLTENTTGTEPSDHKSKELSTTNKKKTDADNATDNVTDTGVGDVATLTPENANSDYSGIDLVGELANASLQTRAESNLLMGEEYNRTVSSMVEMGYAREQVELAMAASFNNPERAVEYLINGIPQQDNLFPPGDDNESPSREANLRQPPVGDASPESAADPFEFLRSQPQFLQMRSLIYQNPHLLHAVLQQIGQTNPALLQLISENQDAFLNMLNQPLEGEAGENVSEQGRQANPIRTDNLAATTAIQAATAEAQRSAAGGDQAATVGSADDAVSSIAMGRNLQQGLATIRLSAQDQDAIDRLKALGFPEALVLQAYFACEKDEELAANFLLSSSFDD